MKIWIDDTYPASDGCIWCKSVDEAEAAILFYERNFFDDKILLDLSIFELKFLNQLFDLVFRFVWPTAVGADYSSTLLVIFLHLAHCPIGKINSFISLL